MKSFISGEINGQRVWVNERQGSEENENGMMKQYEMMFYIIPAYSLVKGWTWMFARCAILYLADVIVLLVYNDGHFADDRRNRRSLNDIYSIESIKRAGQSETIYALSPDGAAVRHPHVHT